MMNIYVAEPQSIDLIDLKRYFPQEQLIDLFEGSTNFDRCDAKDFEILLIRSETVVDAQIKEYFPDLKAIIRVGTGLDKIDLLYCEKEGIRVYNAAGANADAVSEYVITIILYALRRLYLLDDDALLSWDRFRFTGKSLQSQSIGLVGFGNIGRLLHEKLEGFHCRSFVVFDPYVDENTLPEGVRKVDSISQLIESSTIISLHLPLTTETQHIINHQLITSFKEGAILINTSRGEVVDEDAILQVLATRKDILYIADTVSNEPYGDKRLFLRDNIIVTPHVASLTMESEENMLKIALDNFLAGKFVV